MDSEKYGQKVQESSSKPFDFREFLVEEAEYRNSVQGSDHYRNNECDIFLHEETLTAVKDILGIPTKVADYCKIPRNRFQAVTFMTLHGLW